MDSLFDRIDPELLSHYLGAVLNRDETERGFGRESHASLCTLDVNWVPMEKGHRVGTKELLFKYSYY